MYYFHYYGEETEKKLKHYYTWGQENTVMATEQEKTLPIWKIKLSLSSHRLVYFNEQTLE